MVAKPVLLIKIRAALVWCACMLAALVSARADEGLDFVLLVDVSGSMNEHLDRDTNQIVPGNDPQRLRWDAVKLVLDLLTEEDRILVLPFNQNCPAIALPPQTPAPALEDATLVPGALPRELERVTKDFHDRLGEKLLEFIHSRKPELNLRAAEYNGDTGGTGILAALRKAKSTIEAAGGGPGRRTCVVLLTDGREQTSVPDRNGNRVKSEDERKVEDGTWKQDEHMQFFVRRQIPIYTIGLGEKADRGFLEELAVLTGVRPTFLNDNLTLVERFRDLVWSLRDCWTAKVDTRMIGHSLSSGALDDVLDFGVLIFEVDQRQRRPDQPRITFAPQPEPELKWEKLFTPLDPRRSYGKSIPTLDAAGANAGNRPSGYAYYYFDGRPRGGGVAGEVFARSPGLTLRIGLNEAHDDRDIRGYFIKRAQRFRIYLEGDQFYRHQPLPLRVVNERPSRGFDSGNFQVRAKLYSAAAPEKAVSVELIPDSRTSFVCPSGQFTAANLPSDYRDEVDDYVLSVTVEEKARQGAPAYTHALPEQTVLIQNAVLFEQVSPVRVTRGAAEHEVVLRQRYAFQGALPLAGKITFPEGGTPKRSLRGQLDFVPAATPADTLPLTARKGTATLKLGLQRNRPPATGFYRNGRLEFDRADPSKPGLRVAMVDARTGRGRIGPVTVSFEVEIGEVIPEFHPSSTWRDLVVGPKQAEDSQTFAVKLKDPRQAGDGVGPPEIRLARLDGGSLEFSPQELWIEPIRVAEASIEDRSQVLKAGFGEVVRVVFHPDPATHEDQAALVGTHHYGLVVSGKELDPADLKLDLIVQPPIVEVRQAANLEVCLPTDSLSPPIHHQVRMSWLPGGKLAIGLDPPYSTIPFRKLPNDAKVGEIHIPWEGVKSPLWLDALDGSNLLKDTGWTDLAFRLRVPKSSQIEFGQYAGELGLRFRELKYESLPFHLRIDGLYAMHPIVFPADAARFKLPPVKPVRTREVTLLQVFDERITETVAIRTEAGTPLKPEGLQVRCVGPFLADGSGPYLLPVKPGLNEPLDFLPPPTCEAEDIHAYSNHPSLLLVDFHFARVASGFHGRRYYVDVEISYRDESVARDLGTSRFRFELVRLNSRQMVRARPVDE